MILKVQNIGNSKGIILPKQLMAICAIEDRINIEVEDGQLIISPIHEPRAGWDAQFKSAREKGQLPDTDMLNGISNNFDDTEWTW